MKALVAVVAIGLFALSLVAMPQPAAAQGQQPQAPAGQAPAPGEKSVEGKIKSVAGNAVTLEDGTKLMLTETLKVNRTELKPGTMIRASYEQRGGLNVATSLEVKKAQ